MSQQAFHLLAMSRHSYYSQRLKAISALICFASALLVIGCADPLEKPLTQEASEKFQRGITGHGTIGPIDRSNDPTFKSSQTGPQNP